jgi:tetratricopeptide (TPR) repeat protein
MAAQCDWRPPVGKPFHVRVELEDNRIRMLVDGREICGWTDPFPLEGGYLSLFAIGAGKSYTNLRIYRREVPARVSAVAIGDEAARGKAFGIAAAAYERIVSSHGDDALGREALYKLGLCRWRQGLADEALATWEPIVSGPYAVEVRLHRLERACDEGRHDEVIAALPALYRAADPVERNRIALQWGRWIDRVRREGQLPLVARYLALHDEIMPDQTIANHSAAESLLKLGRGDELMRRYPYERYLCTVVLMERGEYDRVIREYPDQRWPCTYAAFRGGIWEGLDPTLTDSLRDEIRWMRGHGEEVAARADVSPLVRSHALTRLGRYEEALAVLRDPARTAPADEGEEGAVLDALIGLGRYDEAAAMSEHGRFEVAIATGRVEPLLEHADAYVRSWARTIAAMQARAAGDRERFRASLPPRLPVLACDTPLLVEQWLLCPLVIGIDSGDFADFDTCCAELAGRSRYAHRQRPGLIARFVRGECAEEAIRNEPYTIFGEVDLALARALKAERHGDRAGALAAWRDFMAKPVQVRDEKRDAGRDALISGRIAELSR